MPLIKRMLPWRDFFVESESFEDIVMLAHNVVSSKSNNESISNKLISLGAAAVKPLLFLVDDYLRVFSGIHYFSKYHFIINLLRTIGIQDRERTIKEIIDTIELVNWVNPDVYCCGVTVLGMISDSSVLSRLEYYKSEIVYVLKDTDKDTKSLCLLTTIDAIAKIKSNFYKKLLKQFKAKN